MTFEHPKLPYAEDALAPHISAETLSFHHGKHLAAYVSKLNAAVEGSDLAGKSLEELVKTQSGGVFNNAAQVWNHEFYLMASVQMEGEIHKTKFLKLSTAHLVALILLKKSSQMRQPHILVQAGHGLCKILKASFQSLTHMMQPTPCAMV